MVKGLTLRPLPVLATAIAVAGLVAVAVDDTVGSSIQRLLQARVAAPDETSSVTSMAGELPDVAIETADGTRTSLAATGGQVRIATMFYSHCPGVCPMTIESLRGVEHQLSAEQRARLGFILLSLDPARDSPGALRSLARKHGIVSSRWVLGRTSESDARAFASAARIRYRHLSDGSIDHSSALVLIDAQGRLLARTSGEGVNTEFVTAVRSALQGSRGRP